METRLVVPGRLPDRVASPVILLMLLLFPELGLPVKTRKRSSIPDTKGFSGFCIFSMGPSSAGLSGGLTLRGGTE